MLRRPGTFSMLSSGSTTGPTRQLPLLVRRSCPCCAGSRPHGCGAGGDCQKIANVRVSCRSGTPRCPRSA
eukprot:11156966-Heterocapsa_arctica.AAC.1